MSGRCIRCDLSLFGPVIPGMNTIQDKPLQWDDLHPSWRFSKLIAEIQKNRSVMDQLFEQSPVNIEGVCDQVCHNLGWELLSNVLHSLSTARYTAIREPYASVFNEFSAAIEFRKHNSYVFFSDLIQGIQQVEKSIFAWDVTGTERLSDFTEKSIEKHSIPIRFTPPIVLHDRKVSTNPEAPKEWAASTAMNYYLSHFVHQMVFSDNLNYPFELFPEH